MTMRAFGVRPGEGEHLVWPDKGHEFSIKVSNEQSDGAFSVVEATTAPNARVGLHVHDQDEEFYWVLEGEYHFTIDKERFITGPGGSVFIPRGTPHGWEVGELGGRTLISFAPAGGERVFREIAAAKAAGGDTPEDWARLGAETHTRWLS